MFDCLGEFICFGYGSCSNLNLWWCNCELDWVGVMCEFFCVNGMNYGNLLGCICYFCFFGLGCNVECLLNGKCVNDKCVCDKILGYKGDVCEIVSCFGWLFDCSNYGSCNGVMFECICVLGWLGVVCDILDCFGDLDCNGCGVCILFIVDNEIFKCIC